MNKTEFKRYHIQRLLKLCESLKKCNLRDYEMDRYCSNEMPPFFPMGRGEITWICFPFVYEAIHKAFPEEWKYFRESGLISYKPNSRYYRPEKAIQIFFNLTPNQFFHCFVAHMPGENLNGKKLTRYSRRHDIIDNIIGLINSINPSLKTRTVLIEKNSMALLSK